MVRKRGKGTNDMPIPCRVVQPIEPTVHDAETLVIVCASYEERSTAVVQMLSSAFRARRTVVFVSEEYADKGKTPEHLAEISAILRRASGGEPTRIEFQIDRPMAAMRQFENMCRDWHKSEAIASIAVDISTFPRQELLVLLRILDNLPWSPSIRLFYAEPAKYGTEEPSGWLTRGVRSVRSVPGFGGTQPPGKKKLLMMFMGHESERAAVTWKRHQPSLTILVIPFPSYRQELDGVVERTQELLLPGVVDGQACLRVPARGVEESEQAVLKIWKQYHDSHYLMVAPLGTKLQTLGVYRASQIKSDIQITYAIPSVYNFKAYSWGIGPIWEICWHPATS